MEYVDFYPQLFHEIPKQDNPAFGDDYCFMIVREDHDHIHSNRAVVLNITPDPVESVNHVAIFWDHDKAVDYCNELAD